MQVDWGKLKHAIERGMNAADKGERGSLRVHCGSAERMAKNAKDSRAKEIAESVHHAMNSFDMAKAREHLEKALATAREVSPDGAP